MNIIISELWQLQEANLHMESKVPSSLSSQQLCQVFSFAYIQQLRRIIGHWGRQIWISVESNHRNGTVRFAIKRSNSTSKQFAKQFSTEIETLSKIRHSHVISPFGYSTSCNEMILVYILFGLWNPC